MEMRILRSLTLAATLGTLAAAMMGSYVRGMGAGLACPDWPLCYGRLIPPLEGAILLEWAHRLVVLLVSFLVLGITFVAWRQRLPERFLALLALSLLIAQAVLGGVTVLARLDPVVVAIHQGLAMIFFGALAALSVLVFRPAGRWIVE